MTVRATVQNGRLIVDQPTDLPDGTSLDLVIDESGYDVASDQKQLLDDAISRSLDGAAATEPVETILTKLRQRGQASSNDR